MTKIDFYLLPDNKPQTLLLCVNKLARKIIKRQSLAYIQTKTIQQSQDIEQSFWHQTPATFLPTSCYQTTEDLFDGSWFGIGPQPAPEHFHQFLINVSGNIPTNFGRFLRLLEIVPATHSARNNSREAYSYYRERGYQLATHQL